MLWNFSHLPISDVLIFVISTKDSLRSLASNLSDSRKLVYMLFVSLFVSLFGFFVVVPTDPHEFRQHFSSLLVSFFVPPESLQLSRSFSPIFVFTGAVETASIEIDTITARTMNFATVNDKENIWMSYFNALSNRFSIRTIPRKLHDFCASEVHKIYETFQLQHWFAGYFNVSLFPSFMRSRNIFLWLFFCSIDVSGLKIRNFRKKSPIDKKKFESIFFATDRVLWNRMEIKCVTIRCDDDSWLRHMMTNEKFVIKFFSSSFEIW